MPLISNKINYDSRKKNIYICTGGRKKLVCFRDFIIEWLTKNVFIMCFEKIERCNEAKLIRQTNVEREKERISVSSLVMFL
jgi:hypothetical protein